MIYRIIILLIESLIYRLLYVMIRLLTNKGKPNMFRRVIVAIIIGIVTAFIFWVAGTLLLPVTPVIAGILISVSYAAGILAGLWALVTNQTWVL